MKNLILLTAALLFSFFNTNAFCGFYVAKADAKLFNESSQVILARNEGRTVITMSSDFKGDVRDFAMVVPVPVVLKEKDIRIAQQLIFDKLDAYSAPRLAQYFDQNPCYLYEYEIAEDRVASKSINMSSGAMDKKKEDTYRVKIEASYTVGEYDILILSAEESGGLKRWLTDNGYKIPQEAEEVLEPYIRSGMKFFVVKVNLEEKEKTGQQTLRPLQLEFESPKFMLPLRLGMANAQGYQDMIVYAFTRSGRVEPANYRLAKIPTNFDIPLFVEKKFDKFYKDLFQRAWAKEGRGAVMLEYAWDLSSSNFTKCDPCVTDPPAFADLKEAGVFWVSGARSQWGSADYSGDVFFTRMHVRYARSNFPQDLFFQETPARENFQGRYVLHKPATGVVDCEAARGYYLNMAKRREKELHNLSAYTGWDISKYAYYPEEALRWAGGASEEKRNEIVPFLPGFGNDGNSELPKNYWSYVLLILLGSGIALAYGKNFRRYSV